VTDVVDTQVIVIRPIRDGELLGLEWDGTYTKFRRVFEQTYEDVVRGQRIILVAVAAGALVGQVFIQLSSTEQRYADGYSRGYLYSLRVRPEWQHRGLGTRLIKAAETALRARGFTAAVIAAGKDNPGAKRLYERLGYHTFGDDPGVWYFVDVNGVQQSAVEPCWVMQKHLEPDHGPIMKGNL
jgi:ribosomal protein S18 acetylase RimI-like enzyme